MGILVTSVKLLSRGLGKYQRTGSQLYKTSVDAANEAVEMMGQKKGNFSTGAVQQAIGESRAAAREYRNTIVAVNELYEQAAGFAEHLRKTGANKKVVEAAEHLAADIMGYGLRLEDEGRLMNRAIERAVKAAERLGISIGATAIYTTSGEANAAEINEEPKLPSKPTILDHILADESSVNERFQAMINYNQSQAPKLARDVDNAEINASLRNKVWEAASGNVSTHPPTLLLEFCLSF
jgi:hypothetical protein